jgi:hypothetical protein
MTASSRRKLMARHVAVTGDTFCIAALKRNIGDWEHFQDCCAEVDGTSQVKSSRKKDTIEFFSELDTTTKKLLSGTSIANLSGSSDMLTIVRVYGRHICRIIRVDLGTSNLCGS